MDKLEKMLGFPVTRKVITPEMNEPHDETFSYSLCQRFYDREEKLRNALAAALDTLRIKLFQRDNPKVIAKLYALIGNMHYMLGEFRQAAGFFIKSLSYEKKDFTTWFELLFCLRAMGEFEMFEAGIFNVEQLYHDWIGDTAEQLNQAKIIQMIENGRDRYN